MAANAPDPWYEAEKWLRTTTGQEFCDELVYGDVGGIHTLNAMLRQFGANINHRNRARLVDLAKKVMNDA
jgi:hypothetical protein